MKCTVFFVSDSTGITVETLGNSLLMQFESIEFDYITIPYVNSAELAEKAVERINQMPGKKIVFSTLVDQSTRAILATCNTTVLDLFDKFLNPMQDILGVEPTKNIGRLHALKNFETYDMRIAAVQYTLNADDGGNTNHYDMADVIVLGVSRCGKTPTCLYMALRYGIAAANFPLTEKELNNLSLPEVVKPYRNKIFGLTISPVRLHEIRQQRYKDSKYSSIEQCRKELSQIESIYKQAGIPFLDTTGFSIEEIATKIIHTVGIKAHHHG